MHLNTKLIEVHNLSNPKPFFEICFIRLKLIIFSHKLKIWIELIHYSVNYTKRINILARLSVPVQFSHASPSSLQFTLLKGKVT